MNTGRIQPGERRSPATEFKPGDQRGAATQFKPGNSGGVGHRFKPGQKAFNKKPVGSVSIRTETHTGSLRAWVKVAEPNVWRKRAVVVWEQHNGPVPAGSIVHHRDHDSLNDALGNLVLKTRSEHALEHVASREGWRKQFMTPEFVAEVRRLIALGLDDAAIARALVAANFNIQLAEEVA